MTERDRISRHLAEDYTEPVRDPLWRHIYLSPAMMRIVDTEPVQQLHRIKQLGPTYLVYPGATHTRLNHSLGVFHIAKRMIARLIHLNDSPEVSLPGVKAFLAAALLHDVGHFPYTHSFKSLPLAEHEQLTGRFILSNPLAQTIRAELGVDPEVVAAIVDESLPPGNRPEIGLYRRLLSGSLDPDKLDYLNRDAYFCGVPYGIQDIDYALSRMVSVGYEGIGLELNALSAVENILFSKYLMYRAVYWHRTVRVATAMIKKAVYCGLDSGEVAAEELYGLDDETFVSGVGGRSFEPFDLIRRVGRRELLKPIVDVAFDDSNRAHRRLETMEARLTAEQAVARDISHLAGRRIPEHEIIIDVPDPISFEIHFPIFDDSAKKEFSDVSVFTPEVVSRFTRTIRRLRVMVPPDVARTKSIEPEAILQVASDAV